MKHIISKKYLLLSIVFVGAAVMAFQLPVLNQKNTLKPIQPSNNWVENELSKLTLREKIGQFFMVAAYSGKGEDHFKEIDSLITKDKVGGVIFFQGERDNLKKAIERFQEKAKTPLLIGMDAEWGVSMRLKNEERFPYNYTIGAANDIELTEKIARMIGQECRELGIHLNFAPVADVNMNPNNPVIGFRAFGEQPKDVAAHVAATVKGMEEQGVMTSIKHFPGHGDTDKDSHYDLPILNNSYEHINAIDFFPFRSGIRAGASSVMVGHLNVPALDPTGTPSSLSSLTIQKYLKGELGYMGLVISDALGMKAITNRYGKTEAVVKAFQAGCDILLFPESVTEAINAIELNVNDGVIDVEKLNDRCRKVLMAKYKAIIKPTKLKSYSKEEITWTKKSVFEKAITVLKNDDNNLPIKHFNQKIAHVNIGKTGDDLMRSMDLVAPVHHFNFEDAVSALKVMDSLSNYDAIFVSLHATSLRSKNDYGMPKGWRDFMKALPSSKQSTLNLFGNPLVLRKNIDLSHIKSIVVCYEDHPLMQDRLGQFIMGTYRSEGKLPITINNEFKRGRGMDVQSAGRLKDSQPEELGISREKLSEIDDIVANSIAEGAFPGCQIVVAIQGKIIYRKSFGSHTYDNKRAVLNTDLYDVASITKIAASTLSLMHLESNGEFLLENKLINYIPEVVEGTRYANLSVKSMMAHQAGLKPWIPFYTKTLSEGALRPDIYSTKQNAEFNTKVADNLWIKEGYTDEIYKQILATTLNSPRYKYSDVGYYFVKKIIEKKTGQGLDKYVLNQFYKPLGLDNLRYNPLDYVDISRIPPTEDDKIFRKKLIKGYVHDQGAAMMGGVGGHAGLFSSASDLAQLMQLFLNKGSMGGVDYISSKVVDKYTGCQYCPTNRRGAGFDKPTTNLVGGPTCNQVSLSSYGHSGFTGTITWADPKHEVNYVFLSNRVYPDAENWKLVRMNIRTDIQDVIYTALKSRKK